MRRLSIKCALVDIQNSIEALEVAGHDYDPKYVEPTLRFYEEVKTQLLKL